MRNPIPDAAEWLFDEYDAPRFWSRVDFNGGQAYLEDPLARITSITCAATHLACALTTLRR